MNYGVRTQGWSPSSQVNQDKLVLTEIAVNIRFVEQKSILDCDLNVLKGTMVNEIKCMRAQLEEQF